MSSLFAQAQQSLESASQTQQQLSQQQEEQTTMSTQSNSGLRVWGQVSEPSANDLVMEITCGLARPKSGSKAYATLTGVGALGSITNTIYGSTMIYLPLTSPKYVKSALATQDGNKVEIEWEGSKPYIKSLPGISFGKGRLLRGSNKPELVDQLAAHLQAVPHPLFGTPTVVIAGTPEADAVIAQLIQNKPELKVKIQSAYDYLKGNGGTSAIELKSSKAWNAFTMKTFGERYVTIGQHIPYAESIVNYLESLDVDQPWSKTITFGIVLVKDGETLTEKNQQKEIAIKHNSSPVPLYTEEGPLYKQHIKVEIAYIKIEDKGFRMVDPSACYSPIHLVSIFDELKVEAEKQVDEGITAADVKIVREKWEAIAESLSKVAGKKKAVQAFKGEVIELAEQGKEEEVQQKLQAFDALAEEGTSKHINKNKAEDLRQKAESKLEEAKKSFNVEDLLNEDEDEDEETLTINPEEEEVVLGEDVSLDSILDMA